MSVNIYKISGIHCQACVDKITEAFKERHIDAIVSLNPPQIEITSERSANRSLVQNILSKAGNYTLVDGVEDQRVKLETESFRPLIIIFGYILLGTLSISYAAKNFSLHFVMNNFMGLFFFVFSMFKMFDIKQFAATYSSYDLLAARSKIYALSYPIIELILSILYIINCCPFVTNLITLALMTISAAGVTIALSNKKKIQCACLGTAFKLPMTKVTLIEDLLMAVMALFALIIYKN